MRTYRITLIGDVINFTIYLDAPNEYEAKEEARLRHPHFTLGGVTEIMQPTGDESYV